MDAHFQPRSAESWRDPFPMYRALRDHDPVHHVVDGDYWVLSRFEDVFNAAAEDARRNRSGLSWTARERILGNAR